jgi:hypothetical protein
MKCVFLSELEDYFEELNDLPLGTITEKIQNTLHTFIQIFVLLYADDTVIFFWSRQYLIQNSFAELQVYLVLKSQDSHNPKPQIHKVV